MKWINVEDRLPTDTGGAHVMCYSAAGIYSLAWFDSRTKTFYDGRMSKVTHWTPLPKPPKEL